MQSTLGVLLGNSEVEGKGLSFEYIFDMTLDIYQANTTQSSSKSRFPVTSNSELLLLTVYYGVFLLHWIV